MAVTMEEVKKALEGFNSTLLQMQEKIDQQEEEAKKNASDTITRDEVDRLKKAVDEKEEKYRNVLDEMQAVKTELQEIKRVGIPTKAGGEKESFDLLKALKGLRFGEWDRDFERKALRRAIPHLGGYQEGKALIDETGSSGGAYLIPDEFSNEWIDLLRSKLAFGQLPIRRISTAAETLRIPKMTTGSTAYMVGSGDAITVSNEVFTQVTMTAHKMGILVPIANELVRRSDPAVMTLVREDMVKQAAEKLESQFIEGDGLTDNMAGIYKTSGLGSVSMGTDGAKFSSATNIDNLMRAVRAVEMANGMMEAWLMNSRTKWDLREVKTSTGDYIMTQVNNAGDPPQMLGYPYYISNKISNTETQGQSTDCSYILCGQFSTVVVADWLQVAVDVSNVATYVSGGTTYSAFQNDLTLLRLLSSHDILVRQPAALCKIIGIRPNTA